MSNITNGKAEIEVEKLKKELMTLGDVLTEEEFSEVINLVGQRNGYVNCRQLISFLMFI